MGPTLPEVVLHLSEFCHDFNGIGLSCRLDYFGILPSENSLETGGMEGRYIKSHKDIPFLFVGDGETACCRTVPLTFLNEIFNGVGR